MLTEVQMRITDPTMKFSHDNAIITYDYRPVKDVIETMSNFYIRHLPVLDKGLQLTGIISSSDILRHIHKVGDLSALEEPVDSIMTRDVISIEPEKPIFDTLLNMYHLNINCIPLIRDGNIVGIVTTKDTLKIQELWDMLDDVEISQYSTNIGRRITQNTIVSPIHSIWQIMDRVYETGFNQVVVMDQKEEITGVVTVLDVLETVIEALKSRQDSTTYLHNTAVSDIMFHSPLTVRAPVMVKLGKKLLLDHHDECLILSSYQSPHLLISERDFFNFLVHEMKEKLM